MRCPFCLEGSQPGDGRIEFLTTEDVLPFMDEAMELGVKKLSFTGGEPFVNPHMVAILAHALEHRPCLVLSNGTEPLMNRLHEILPLQNKSHPLGFRISLDHPDEQAHDRFRGKGNFRKALTTLGKLHESGFEVSIARFMQGGEDTDAINQRYRLLFQTVGVPADTTIVPFPDFHPPGSQQEVPQVTEHCMTQYLTADQRRQLMCNFSKMIVKRNGRVGVYACTLVDDDPDYRLAESLTESMEVRVMLKHHRCYSCFAYGASCSEGV